MEYNEVISRIEVLLQKSNRIGGVEKLRIIDATALRNLSEMAKQYEDSHSMMPLKSPTV